MIHMDDQLKTLQSWINESSYTVAVTGAGVSVTAGIPDMQHMNIVSTLQMMSETILKAAPGRYYKGVYKGFLKAVYENGPTETHRKLAQLESVGKLQGIITTNIDCLHSIPDLKMWLRFRAVLRKTLACPAGNNMMILISGHTETVRSVLNAEDHYQCIPFGIG